MGLYVSRCWDMRIDDIVLECFRMKPFERANEIWESRVKGMKLNDRVTTWNRELVLVCGWGEGTHE